MFSQDFKEFVELLIKNEVEYMIVGGYAVGIHGYPRYTGDLDIWLHNTPENAIRILKAVNEFGFSTYGLSQSDFIKPDSIIQLGYPPMRIDLLTQIDGVRFDACFPNRKEVEIEGLKINFIGYHDLMKNKKASGRNRDKDDMENLV
jgi:hypothetical protein